MNTSANKGFNTPGLLPEIYGVEGIVQDFFPVNRKQALATTSLENSMGYLVFKDQTLVFERVLSDYFEDVSGGEQRYMDTVFNQIAGYSQERRFIQFDFLNRSFKKQAITRDSNEYIEQVQVVDWQKKQFIFELWHAFYDENKKFLRIIDLSDDSVKTKAELQIGFYSPLDMVKNWTLHGHIIIVYGGTAIDALNLDLKPTSHPILDYFRRYKNPFVDIQQIAVHPLLPFAVFVDIIGTADGSSIVNKLWLMRWNHPKPEEVLVENYPLGRSIVRSVPLSADFFISKVFFSPDGTRLIVVDTTEQYAQFVAFTVKPDEEKFLGPPLLLGGMASEESPVYAMSWILDPLSFVVSYGEMIYVWRLDQSLTK
ncbi:MAG: hypothetical protein JW795_03625 [Chitinivibrionales bacterium]|nr:hypothetical protein [Chitinivibrionales bacterium]